KNCRRICKLLRKHREGLFTFLDVEGVGWNNNEAERALRPSVVVRKNSYGSKSELGARNHAILMTIGENCKKHGENFMSFGRSYLQASTDVCCLPKR
ncbi:MAG: transposase, partial [Candidatus Hodarchaeaceae archaeon]|nr:transposase [Candidatus Hodarchaeaceae archaeon]